MGISAKCQAKTKKGRQCRNRAVKGDYCEIHYTAPHKDNFNKENTQSFERPNADRSLVKVDQPKWMDYKVGTRVEGGEVITQILGKDEICCVWMYSGAGLWWDYDKSLGKNARLAISYAKRLHMQVISTIPSKKQQRQVVAYIGSILFGALHRSDLGSDADVASYFSDVEQLIETKSKEASHYIYLFSGVVIVALVGLIWFIVYLRAPATFLSSGFYKVLFGCVAGGTGALLSIVSRFRTIEIQRYASVTAIGTQGIIRVLLGFLSGIFLVMTMLAGFISLPANNIYAIGVICMVAGFSERLVPELVGKFESGIVDKADVSKTGDMSKK